MLKLIAGPEQTRVVGHMEHRHKGQAPRVLPRFVAPQDRDTLVNAERDLSIAAGSEHRSGAGVRVDEQNLVGRHREPARRKILDIPGAKREACEVCMRRPAADCEEAEANRMMDGMAEQESLVLE